jgi:hypothetical protein
MTTEQQVAEQYRHGALERAIFDAVAASGKDIDRLNLPISPAWTSFISAGGRNHRRKENTCFQSRFMSTTVQPFLPASSNALSSRPTAEFRSYAHSRSASV